MKIRDVKLKPITQHGMWVNWKNDWTARAVSNYGKKITVIDHSKKTKDWPEYDPDPAHCTGHGHATCVKQGEHSWFNHSTDSYYTNNLSNLPEGFIEP